MQHYDLSLRSWAAFSPFMMTPEDWYAWSSVEDFAAVNSGASEPDVSFIPPRLRRRLGPLGRAALWCAGQVEGEQHKIADAAIFCSQHGDVSKTLSLLKDLASGGLPSPAGFSHSVHNAAAGIYSISQHSHRPVTAISAGPDGVFTAMLECYVQLQELLASGTIDPQVLCVVYDDSVPPELLKEPAASRDVQAMAVLVGLPTDDSLDNFSIGLLPPIDQIAPDASTDHFLSFLLGGTPSHILLRGEGRQWSLRRVE